mmetsp:Transcript_14578/g.29534  ORF Transcript_14578/g.29534 Transcript_14578/m.29534 type:complete len:355 (+) Transcript_14578:2578-3642(+)
MVSASSTATCRTASTAAPSIKFSNHVEKPHCKASSLSAACRNFCGRPSAVTSSRMAFCKCPCATLSMKRPFAINTANSQWSPEVLRNCNTPSRSRKAFAKSTNLGVLSSFSKAFLAWETLQNTSISCTCSLPFCINSWNSDDRKFFFVSSARRKFDRKLFSLNAPRHSVPVTAMSKLSILLLIFRTAGVWGLLGYWKAISWKASSATTADAFLFLPDVGMPLAEARLPVEALLPFSAGDAAEAPPKVDAAAPLLPGTGGAREPADTPSLEALSPRSAYACSTKRNASKSSGLSVRMRGSMSNVVLMASPSCTSGSNCRTPTAALPSMCSCTMVSCRGSKPSFFSKAAMNSANPV